MRSASHPARAALQAALVASLLCLAVPRAAAAGGTLELRYGPDESEWLTLRTLQVVVDGQAVPVSPPARGADPGQVLLERPLAPGSHRLEVATGLEGDSSVFTYVEGHHFKMRGVLQLDVQPGDVVGVRARVVAQPGVTVQWQDRYRLALDATVRRSPQPEVAAAPPAPAPAPAAAPPAPPPAVASAPPPAAPPAAAAPAPAPPRPAAPAPAACAVEPLHFAFDQSALSTEAEAALDRLAACLGGSARAVRVEGHCDSRGPDLYNEWLGAQRAAAAARHLRARGVAPERITVRSMSAGHPVCTGRGEACHARNRRVELQVLE